MNGFAKDRSEAAEASNGVRLQRVLAGSGIASRRKSEELIRAGRVSVDGKVVTELGTRVDPARASIRVDGKPVRRQPHRYMLMHKPSGFITTTNDDRGRHTVMELLPPGSSVYPVGRLDRDTEGLLLFTNDGEVANRVMHPRYGLTKEYLVLTANRPPEATMRRVRDGIEIDGKRVMPHEFRIVRETNAGVLLSMVVHEGMRHVVRRMMESVGIDVAGLRRVRIGPLSVAGIPRGAHRELTTGEVASLLESLHINRDDGRGMASIPRPAKKEAAPVMQRTKLRTAVRRAPHE
ncbi:MAG: rRNA pseudouridine synthase [Chloroflexia bacterium]|nr:rRNA pseudouridine synthase [Chloroflexia bacterium]